LIDQDIINQNNQ